MTILTPTNRLPSIPNNRLKCRQLMCLIMFTGLQPQPTRSTRPLTWEAMTTSSQLLILWRNQPLRKIVNFALQHKGVTIWECSLMDRIAPLGPNLRLLPQIIQRPGLITLQMMKLRHCSIRSRAMGIKKEDPCQSLPEVHLDHQLVFPSRSSSSKAIYNVEDRLISPKMA